MKTPYSSKELLTNQLTAIQLVAQIEADFMDSEGGQFSSKGGEIAGIFSSFHAGYTKPEDIITITSRGRFRREMGLGTSYPYEKPAWGLGLKDTRGDGVIDLDPLSGG
jgi:hypothetical protein